MSRFGGDPQPSSNFGVPQTSSVWGEGPQPSSNFGVAGRSWGGPQMAPHVAPLNNFLSHVQHHHSTIIKASSSNGRTINLHPFASTATSVLSYTSDSAETNQAQTSDLFVIHIGDYTWPSSGRSGSNKYKHCSTV